MEPGGVGGEEAAHVEGGDDGAGLRLGGDVVEVGDRRVEPGVVAVVQRQAPDGVVGGGGGGVQGGGPGVVVGEIGGDVGADGDAGGAGEGGAVDQDGGFFVGGFGEEVAQDEAALGVGVADFDGEAAAGADDVERAHGAAGDRVFDAADAHDEADRQVGIHQHGGEAEDVGGTTHVFFHPQHGGGGLEIVAAGVEDDALAAERDQGGIGGGLAAGPAKHGDDGWAVRARADGGDGGVFAVEVGTLGQGAGGVVGGGEGGGGGCEFGGAEQVGRGVDEGADAPGGAGLGDGAGGGGGGHQAGGGALGGAEFGVAIGAEAEAEGGGGGVVIALGEFPVAFGEREGEATECKYGTIAADAEHGGLDTGGAGQETQFVGLAGEGAVAQEGGLGRRACGEPCVERVGPDDVERLCLGVVVGERHVLVGHDHTPKAAIGTHGGASRGNQTWHRGAGNTTSLRMRMTECF